MTNFEVGVVENVEQFGGFLLDLSEVDDHILDVDAHVQSDHVLKLLLRAAETLECVLDELLQLVEDVVNLSQLCRRLRHVLLYLRVFRLQTPYHMRVAGIFAAWVGGALTRCIL